MTDPAAPTGAQVSQADYIQVLKDDLARESAARQVLQALVNQRTRTLTAYIERFGDITEESGGGDGGGAPAR